MPSAIMTLLPVLAFLNVGAEKEPMRAPEWAIAARLGACTITLSETAAELSDLADRLADAGYTVVTVHPGHLCYDILDYDTPRHWPALKRFVDACHARGMRVVLKTMTLWHDKQRSPQYERYAGWSARHGATTYHLPPRPGANAWYSCLNHPVIRDAHVTKLPALLEATGADGFMTDALIRPDMYSCVCEHCRRTFRRDTGFEAPASEEADFWGRHENPAYRAWLLWRYQSVTDFLLEIREALAAMERPRALLEYYAPGIPSMLKSATDHEVLADAGACMIGQEVGVAPASQYNWRFILAKLNHVQSLCQLRGRVPYAIIHNTYAESCPHLFRSLTWLAGLRKWEYPVAYGAVRGVTVSRSALRWDEEHEDLLSPVRRDADVAIVYSRRSYVLVKATHREGPGSKDPLDAEYFGWAEALLEHDIPYHSLLDGDLTAERLGDYRVLILPAIACLSRDSADAIRRFLADGGRLVAVGPTSRYAADGEQLPDFRLADVFGVHYRGFSGARATLAPEIGADVPERGFDVPIEGFTVTEQAEGSQRAASLVTGEDGQPGIVTHRYGGGEGIYVAFAAGQQTCHVVNYLGSRGGTWTAPPARELHDVMLWAVGAKAARPLRRVSVPPGVVTNVLTQRTADGERLVVHLLNLQLTEVGPDGAEIDKGTEVVYPWVERPLVFDLRVDGPCHARMLSPDFDGVWHLDARPAPARGFTRITVPELARYALICVEPGEADEPPGASQQHGDRDFEIAGGVRLTGAWRDEGMVQRPIGSRPCACRQFAHPAEAPAAPGGAVQVDIPVPVDAADGLQLRFWESDLCRDATGGRGLFRKLLLVNGREVSCRPMLGDGSWIEHRVDIAEAVGPDATNVISLRVENTGETSPAGQVRVCEMLYTTGRWQLWRGERRVRDLDLPQG